MSVICYIVRECSKITCTEEATKMAAKYYICRINCF